MSHSPHSVLFGLRPIIVIFAGTCTGTVMKTLERYIIRRTVYAFTLTIAAMTGVVWALPAQVVLIGAMIAGNSLIAAAFAVALSSVRLAPMVVALTPEMRGPRTRKWVLYALSHFVAITSWVLAMESFRTVPRDLRTAYYTGIGTTLVLVNMGVVATVFLLAERLPLQVSAALFFLTPIYFLTSLWGSARERAGHVAMVLGLLSGPVFHLILPGFDLLAAGGIAGGAAYIWHRIRLKKGADT